MSEPINKPTSGEINLEEIVKKPRTATAKAGGTKPRMSKIVTKAVLLKQISDSKIIGEPDIIEIRPSTSEDIIEEVFTPKPTKKIKAVPTVVPSPVPPSSDTISITSYKCDLCDTVFTSKVLYERHPRTIRHKTNLIKKFEAVNLTKTTVPVVPLKL